MQELKEPNDLLHFFYKYGVRELPISRNGEITGKLPKASVVRHLSRSENFESSVVTTIEKLVEPADVSFFESLKDELKAGTIKGIPVVRETGKIEQVVTPGVLDAQAEANQYVDESKKREIYERLLDQFPFPIVLERNSETVYENDESKKANLSDGWSMMEWEEDDLTLRLYLPDFIQGLFDDFCSVREGDSIEMRELLENVEKRFMEEAYDRAESVSGAAELVELPRQTFNYRWQKIAEEEASSKQQDNNN